MLETKNHWTFFIASTAVSAALAEEIKTAITSVGHALCGVCDNYNLLVILSLEETIAVGSTTRNSLEWLKDSIDGLEYGGGAIAFCPCYLNATQRQYLRLSTPELKSLTKDHGATNHGLLFSFDSALQLLEKLLEIPENFSVSDLDSD